MRHPGILLRYMVHLKPKQVLLFLALIVSFCSGVLVVLGNLLPMTLVVETEKETCLSLPTSSEDNFSLRFTHSVHKTPVWENFTVIRSDKLILTSTEYQSYGVGMPFLPSEGTFIQERDRFILRDLNREFSQIPVRAGPEAKLTLIHGGREYPLYEMVEPGTLLFIHSEKKLFGFFRL